MSYIYCGTDPPVRAMNTRQLLLGPFNAIWFPPRIPVITPAGGDIVWLVWRSANTTIPLFLGGGRVVLTDKGNVRWTNATLPGVRQAAEVLGYHGPANMAFLRLTEVVISEGFPQVKLGAIHGGLNIATPEQELALQEILPIR